MSKWSLFDSQHWNCTFWYQKLNIQCQATCANLQVDFLFLKSLDYSIRLCCKHQKSKFRQTYKVWRSETCLWTPSLAIAWSEDFRWRECSWTLWLWGLLHYYKSLWICEGYSISEGNKFCKSLNEYKLKQAETCSKANKPG